MWRADNERLESFRARNAAFAWMDAILAAMAVRRVARRRRDVAQARPEPTTTFDDRLELTIGGRRLELLSVPGGETTDALVVWLPDDRALRSPATCSARCSVTCPNLVTIRGDRYRDALAYVASVDRVLALAPERLITGHFDPIDGADRIAEELDRDARRDALGARPHRRRHERAAPTCTRLMREIAVPDHLDVGEGYGKTSWNVRAIWENYAGWFHHRSTTELYGVPAVVGRRRRRRGGRRRRAASPRPARTSTPAARSRRCTSPTSCSPPSPDHAGGAARSPPTRPARCWTRARTSGRTAWLRRSIDTLESGR